MLKGSKGSLPWAFISHFRYLRPIRIAPICSSLYNRSLTYASNMTKSMEPDRSPYTLPKDFLLGPGPEKTVQKIDFARISLPEYDGHYAVVIDNALTKEECDSLVRAAETKNGGEWEQAMVNVGGGRQKLMIDARDCGRIIWDDRDIVEKIWSRVKDSVPEIEFLKELPSVTGNWPVARKETLKMSRLNERMRFLRYEDSQYFRRKPTILTFQSWLWKSIVLTISSTCGWHLHNARQPRKVILHPPSLPQ